MDFFYINNKKVSDDILKEKITDDNNLTLYINKCFQIDNHNLNKELEDKELADSNQKNEKYRIEKYLDYEIFTFGNDDYYYYD